MSHHLMYEGQKYRIVSNSGLKDRNNLVETFVSASMRLTYALLIFFLTYLPQTRPEESDFIIINQRKEKK